MLPRVQHGWNLKRKSKSAETLDHLNDTTIVLNSAGWIVQYLDYILLSYLIVSATSSNNQYPTPLSKHFLWACYPELWLQLKMCPVQSIKLCWPLTLNFLESQIYCLSTSRSSTGYMSGTLTAEEAEIVVHKHLAGHSRSVVRQITEIKNKGYR